MSVQLEANDNDVILIGKLPPGQLAVIVACDVDTCVGDIVIRPSRCSPDRAISINDGEFYLTDDEATFVRVLKPGERLVIK